MKLDAKIQKSLMAKIGGKSAVQNFC